MAGVKGSGKGRRGPKAGKAKGGASSEPPETVERPVIAAGKLLPLLKAAKTANKDVSSINGTLRERIGYAKEHDHLHTGVFTLLSKLYRMEDEDLADYLYALRHGLEAAGLNARAAKVIRMEFGPGKDAGEEDGDEDTGNVRAFPKQTAVAAE